MKGKNLFTDFKVEILDKKPDNLPKNFELAGYNDADMMFMKAIAVHEGVNANGALMERADLNKAKYTFVGKPLKIRFMNNNPTGHGYDAKNNTFDELVKNIGFIYDAEAQVVMEDGTVETFWGDDIPEGGKYQIVVYMVMWQKYYPQIALRLRQLHTDGDLNFSIEAERDFEITPEGYRKCFNILFNGLAVVQNPAFEGARSLMVAELLEKEEIRIMNFEELYKAEMAKNENLVKEKALAEQAKETAEKERDNAVKELATVKEQLLSKEGEIKTVVAERDTYKTTVETAEKDKLGKERLTKLQKYGEVSKSEQELAEMTQTDFLVVLEEMIDNYKPTGQENAEKDNVGIVGVPRHNTGLPEDIDARKTLLSMVEKLA